jgi:hypothetical protein
MTIQVGPQEKEMIMTSQEAMDKLFRIYRYLRAQGDITSARLVYRLWYWRNEEYY